jgi:anti-anti-sigma factor
VYTPWRRPSLRPNDGVVIEDVLSQAGGPADRIHPSQPGPIPGTLETNDDSGLRLSYPGVMARPSHRADAVPQGFASRLPPVPDPDEVLRVKGLAELTAHNVERFRGETNAALNGHTSIEIDLSDTIVMDCSALGALIALRNCTRRRNGVVRLMSPNPAVRRLIEIVRAEQMFEIVPAVGLDPIVRNVQGNARKLGTNMTTPVESIPAKQDYSERRYADRLPGLLSGPALWPMSVAVAAEPGVKFGAGFTLLGYCPGRGSWDALFGMAGLVAGSWRAFIVLLERFTTR